MKLHFLGIGGTFMGSLAVLAREAGYEVSGSDQNVYPPMSDILDGAGITYKNGYEPEHIEADTELVIIGNALSRGNRAVEHVLDQRLPYASGPDWLGRHVLAGRKVIAVCGTHGKTTTTSMVATILDHAGLDPGFLIGGAPTGFATSARLGEGEWFVIEGDEYDTAFFDKRSKFVHYRANVAILNNLEFDHADIFPDLAAIETQFHHLVRTVPGRGALIVNDGDGALARVLERGCWSQRIGFGSDNTADWRIEDAARPRVFSPDGSSYHLDWSVPGAHNRLNALAAIAAAHEAGVDPGTAVEALRSFTLPRRRQEVLASHAGMIVIDDFAHHPTAIAATLEALREQYQPQRILVAMEPRSNTMRAGVHDAALAASVQAADQVLVVADPPPPWTADAGHIEAISAPDAAYDRLTDQAEAGDLVVFMSNGSFSGLPRRVADWVKSSS